MAILRTLFTVVSFCLAPAFVSAVAQEPSASSRPSQIEASENKAALEAAYIELERVTLLSTEHVVVIRRVGKYIVVSTIPSAQNVRGGRAHVVYDPVQKKTVRTLGED